MGALGHCRRKAHPHNPVDLAGTDDDDCLGTPGGAAPHHFGQEVGPGGGMVSHVLKESYRLHWIRCTLGLIQDTKLQFGLDYSWKREGKEAT